MVKELDRPIQIFELDLEMSARRLLHDVVSIISSHMELISIRATGLDKLAMNSTNDRPFSIFVPQQTD